jgi:hypothetical protein
MEPQCRWATHDGRSRSKVGSVEDISLVRTVADYHFIAVVSSFLHPGHIAPFPSNRYESDFTEAATPFGTGLIPFLIENTEGETKLQLQALPSNCRLSLRRVLAPPSPAQPSSHCTQMIWCMIPSLFRVMPLIHPASAKCS